MNFLKKLEVKQTLKDWKALDVDIGGILGKENIVIDLGKENAFLSQ